MSEKEHHGKRHSDEEQPDVEAHRHFHKRGDDGPTPTEAEHHVRRLTDDEDDDTPDVEAHRFKAR